MKITWIKTLPLFQNKQEKKKKEAKIINIFPFQIRNKNELNFKEKRYDEC